MSTPMLRDDLPEAFGLRIAAALIDLIAVGALLFLSVAMSGDVTFHGNETSVTISGAGIGTFAALTALYFCVMEATVGQTLGKLALSLRVVRATDESRIGWREAALRTLLRPIDFLPVLYIVGVLVASRSERHHRQRLGDLVAGTLVVRC